MNKGNPQFTSWTYEGDIAEATKWLPYAVGMLKSCAKRAVVRHTETPSDGVLITVDSTTGRVHIKAGAGLYLESGFIELRSTAPLSQYTYMPSWLYYSDRVKDYMSSLAHPLQGKALTSIDSPFYRGQNLPERETLVTTCKDAERVTSIKLDTTAYSNPYPIYCNTDEIRRLKFIQQYIPPSVFSGKLRLFVQALYGTPKRTDYSTIEEYPASCYPFYLQSETGTLQLGYDLQYHQCSSGLLTTSNQDYYIITISSSTVTATKLEFKGAAEAFRKHLIAHKAEMQSDDVKRAEAYILGNAIIGATQNVSVNLSSVVGSPIAYGWQFKWDGSEARIITHKDNLPTDQYWWAREYKLSFSASNGNITATLTAIGSYTKWAGVGNKIVWVPDYLTGQMAAFVNPKKTPFVDWTGEIDSGYEADIYCFYDENDVLQRVTVGNAFTAAAAVSDTNYAVCGIGSNEEVIFRGGGTIPKSYNSWVHLNGSGYNYNTRAQYNNQSVTVYKYVGLGDWEQPDPYSIAELLSGTVRRLPNDTSSAGPRMCSGETPEAYAGFPYADGVTSYINEYVTYQSPNDSSPQQYQLGLTYNSKHNIVELYNLTGKTESKTVKHVVFIPHLDCSKVFIGEKYIVSDTETGRAQQYKNGRTIAIWKFVKWFRWGSNLNDRVLVEEQGPFEMNGNRIFNQLVGDGVMPTQTSYTGRVSVSNMTGLIFETNISGYDNLGLYSTYFDVDYVSNPYGSFASYSKTSIQGDSMLQITGLVSSTDGYIKDVSVGWA